MRQQEHAHSLEKEMPAGGTAGTSKSVIGESGDQSFTKNSPERQSENGPVAKLEWLKQVASDGSLPPNATRVAIAIASHVNGKSGVAWPSAERIAEILSLNSRSVRRCIGALVGGGYLAVEVGGGSASNRYSLLHDGVAPMTPASGGEATPDATVSTPGRYCQGGSGASVRGARALAPYELLENNSERELGERTLSLERVAEIIPIDRGEERFNRTRGGGKQLAIPVEIVESSAEPRDFAAFWHVYPKKIGRLEAGPAFSEALKHADASEIIAGARRYAEARQAAESDPVERERFTKSAERWLKGRHWRDEYAAPRPAGLGRHAAEALADAYGDEDWGVIR